MRKRRSQGRKPFGQRRRRATGDDNTHERRFAARWAELGGPPLVVQHPFHPTRRYKLDFAVPDVLVGVEIQGGVWARGRHVSGVGYWADRIRQNSAQRLGWIIFELVPNDIDDDRVYAEILDEVERRRAEGVRDRAGLNPFADVHAESRRGKAARAIRAAQKALRKEARKRDRKAVPEP